MKKLDWGLETITKTSLISSDRYQYRNILTKIKIILHCTETNEFIPYNGLNLAENIVRYCTEKCEAIKEYPCTYDIEFSSKTDVTICISLGGCNIETTVDSFVEHLKTILSDSEEAFTELAFNNKGEFINYSYHLLVDNEVFVVRKGEI